MFFGAYRSIIWRWYKNLQTIKQAIELAEKYAVPKLDIKNSIDIIVTDAFYDVIPEIHLGGHAYRSDFITTTIDSDTEIKLPDLFLIICHELTHATRWQINPEWTNFLQDEKIMEGLAIGNVIL
ncbi:hypothetical protein HG461_003105 [Candidatus Saccharibacteria bacterium]|nr:hypothetical protein [Candidatus Saccharibacteria bacterium]MBB1532388.1 hypothetical protein [Candidatus Saccharibacteria bacterium]